MISCKNPRNAGVLIKPNLDQHIKPIDVPLFPINENKIKD